MAQTSLRNRVTRLWFAVLTVGLAAFTLASFQDGLCEGDRCGETLVNDDDVGVLKNASVLIERERGDTNQPSPEWLVFQKFLAIGKLGRDAIAGLLQKATPAGRLYAVILLKELDQAESTKVLNRMMTQSDKVLYIRGCSVETTTVGALAKRIIKGDKLVAMSNAKDAFAQNAASLDKTGNATNSKITKETIALLDEWGDPASNTGTSAFRFVGYQLKPFCKYEKREANLAELCKNLKEDQISFDEFLGVDASKLDQKSRWAYQRGMPTVVGSNAEVIYVLRKSRAVTSHDWHHKYHHVAHKDQHGYITRSDGTKIIWMLRPGGLGVLVYPDGGTIFMALEEVGGLK